MESTNLVELVKNIFSQDILNHAAGQLHEDKVNLENAINGIIPAVLLRLEAKSAASKYQALNSMIEASQAIINNENDTSEGLKKILSNPSDANGIALVEKADSILNELFDDRLNAINKVVSNASSIKHSSGLRMLSMITPATILTIFSQSNKEGQVNSKETGQLINQKASIINSIPSGLDLTGALGVEELSQVDITPEIPRITDTDQQRKPHKVSFIQWIIILALAMGILFGFYAGCGSNRFGVTMELPPVPASNSSTNTTNNNQ